ncbi:hypothetical protein [Streptococcus parauberis]
MPRKLLMTSKGKLDLFDRFCQNFVLPSRQISNNRPWFLVVKRKLE